MSSTETQDFNNFQLGDDVRELADGLMVDIGEAFHIDLIGLDDEALSVGLGEVVGRLGKNKELRNNEEVTVLSDESMANLLDRSGVQTSLDRSLWTPSITTSNAEVDALIMTGAVANWQDRIAAQVVTANTSVPIHYATSDRVMGTPTEKVNPNVMAMFEAEGDYPTESQYAAQIIIPKLVEAGFTVISSEYAGANGDQLAEGLFGDFPELAFKNLVFGRVANAGLQLACQMRVAARKINPDFDGFQDEPQVFVVTDSFPVAITPEQKADAAHYQNPQTGLRQAVLSAKLIHEAAIGIN